MAVPLNDLVAFQPEALLQQAGARSSPTQARATKIKLDYLQVPLLGRFKLATDCRWRARRPDFGFRTKATLDVPGAPADFSDDFEDEIERFDFGLVAGVTVDAGRLVLDGRYTWG